MLMFICEIPFGKAGRKLFLYLTFLLCFSPLSLFADRVYLRDGRILRGKILRIEASHYKLKKSDASTERVPKSEVKKVIFGREKTEKGYDKFFLRSSFHFVQTSYEEKQELIAGNSAA